MLTPECLGELRSAWLPNITDAGLLRLIDLLEKGSPLLIHGCFTRAVPMGCLATHVAWNHPRTAHLNHSLTVIALLQSSLDFEKGGEVARQLERFYNVFRGRVLEASIKSSPEILQDIIAQFRMMRDAWSEVDAAESRSATAVNGPLPETLAQPTAAVASHWGA